MGTPNRVHCKRCSGKRVARPSTNAGPDNDVCNHRQIQKEEARIAFPIFPFFFLGLAFYPVTHAHSAQSSTASESQLLNRASFSLERALRTRLLSVRQHQVGGYDVLLVVDSALVWAEIGAKGS